jgi:vitamin B12 transporter
MSRHARFPAVFFVFLLSLAVSVATVAAQDDAAIRGAVVDPLGARVAGAAVTLLRDGQSSRSTSTSNQGDFVFEGLPEGRYQIRVTSEGFQPRVTAPMFVAASGQATVEVSLPLGPLETSLTVTAAATEILPSQIGAPVTVLDAQTLESIGKLDVIEALRLVPGNSLVQTGGRGGTASSFIRGGNSNFNKMLIDGVPANDIGGGVDLAQFSMTGVDRVEVLREANSVIAGPDALAGVISVMTPRGVTRIPEASLSLDAGNLGTHRESAGAGGVVRRFDYFSQFTRFSTDNDLPNNQYRIKTYAGRFGTVVGQSTDLNGSVRWLDKRYASPNAMNLYGTPDDAFQTARTYLVGFGGQTLISERWQASVRVGLSDQRAHFANPTLSGQIVSGVGFGDVTTIKGANGYSVTGQGALDWGLYDSHSRAARQGVYAQTSYQLYRNFSLAGGGNYEREQAFTDPDADPTTTRNNTAIWIEGRGTLIDRVSVTAGLGHADIEGYASRFTPRVSVAIALRKSTTDEFWSDTRLTFNAGEGIKGTSVTSVNSSLYSLLIRTPQGAALAEAASIGPIGPERGRNLDFGLEQGLWRGRARARAAYFDNEFFDLVEFVSRNLLPQFGIPPDVAAATGTGAYVNSQSFKAKGVEVSMDALFGGLRVGGSYTFLDAIVTKSLSSNVTPQFNPRFPGIPIGGYTALVGERPFRRPANTGNLLIAYARGRTDVALTGYFAGRADDSTHIVGSDINFGNTMLLPNRNLNFGYQKVDVSGAYRIHPRLRLFATLENLLDQEYEPSFGFPALPINLRMGLTVTLGGR